ncbi:PLP-dependent aminotransferase family protein [Geomonas subterranea]|uniref:PLP-dependent aminotransferase family protein n=1 Tax=Geomonas subterranea TaxID=2847989 RepID=A0ABX8LPV5_9BACT|nr:PLP-dependent aminotransferase family protein [Geomonas subterranea]QXE92624.1 PLP-dependent aminotransferase family protein [Geomonas subterranea]QXM09277.1 PLP-dependent aminotransferase family protein [Geomonas subterranea]
MFIIDQNDNVPLYRQLYHQIREQVLSGRLPAHAKLPSVRDLATELSISRNTVEGAYQELFAEGYIYSRQRIGYFVSALDQLVAPATRGRAPVGEERPPRPEKPARFDFHPARLDPAGFPLAQWRGCLLESLREGAGEFSHYGDFQGDWELRCNLQKYLERSRGVVCGPERIFVCAGLQHSLDLVAHLLKDAHSTVAVENPGYHLPRAVFQNSGFRIAPVDVGPGGMDLEALKASGGTIAYVTPSHQLPMGCVMPIANRLNLIDWAGSGGKLIIEDDYDSELRYHGKPIPSLQGLRPEGEIIYLGTFSKVLSPALRLSYMVLPPSLLDGFSARYRDYFPTVPSVEQKTMAKFMAQGYWERHIRRMRIVYQKKHDAMLKAIDRYFGAMGTVLGAGAGLHMVLQLRACASAESAIISKAAANGIYLFPFSATCAGSAPAMTRLMLGFGGMTATDIEVGIRLLADTCLKVDENCP